MPALVTVTPETVAAGATTVAVCAAAAPGMAASTDITSIGNRMRLPRRANAISLTDGYSITAVGISLQDLLWAAVRVAASLGKRLLKRPRLVINLPARNLLLVTYDHRRWRIPGRQKRSRTWIIDRIRSLREAVEQRKLGGVRIFSACARRSRGHSRAHRSRCR